METGPKAEALLKRKPKQILPSTCSGGTGRSLKHELDGSPFSWKQLGSSSVDSIQYTKDGGQEEPS